MLTEHPLLDDSGDKKGTTDPKADGKNGRVAAMLSLGTAQSAEPLPADPKMRALYEERRDARAARRGAEADEGRHGAGALCRASSRSC